MEVLAVTLEMAQLLLVILMQAVVALVAQTLVRVQAVLAEVALVEAVTQMALVEQQTQAVEAAARQE
jgi:hypothetical protein